MRCLLVDDSRTMRNIQKNVLAAVPGLECAEAADGVEALAVIAASPGPFAFIMIDWNMPNMDGITLVRRIRQTDKKTPLLMATTEGEKERVIEAIQAGVNNYVVKPFTPDVLLKKITETITKAKAAA